MLNTFKCFFLLLLSDLVKKLDFPVDLDPESSVKSDLSPKKSFRHTDFKNFFFFQYHWADGNQVKKPIKCSAPKYIDFLMTWVQVCLAVLRIRIPSDPKLFVVSGTRPVNTVPYLAIWIRICKCEVRIRAYRDEFIKN